MATLEKVDKAPKESEKCDIDCKCHQIMANLSDNIDLSDQIGYDALYDIFLTIFVVLQNLSTHEDGLIKIANTCQEVYEDLNPKEMGRILN